MNLPEFSVKRPVTTLMTFVAALVVGGVCLWQLPIDLMPKMEMPAISVITMYEGAGPEDVEEKVTDVLERSLSTVPELKHIVSKSKEGFSVITLSFEWGTAIDARANEVRDAIGMAKMQLPDEIDEPRVFKFDINQFPIMVFGVMARQSFPDLERILDDEIVKPLKRIPGVGSAAAMVPLQRQVNVNLDRDRLAAYGLTPQDVVAKIASENVDTPAGSLKVGSTDYLLRVPGEFGNVEEISRVVLASRDGSVVRLSDVGTVEDGFKDLQMHVTINANPGGVIMVQKQSGANTVQVARLVRARMKELQKRLPSDIQLLTVMDSSEDIEMLIRDLGDTLIIGAVLTMVIVLIFLRRWQPALVIGLTMPFSLILAIIVVYFLGYTINMMTLFAMIVAVGMIVDNAIVVVDVITRHREEGERANEGAIYGASEVAMAVTASTLTTVCIFFPILFVKGITRIIFSEFAIIVCVILLGSLFSALSLSPMLAAVLMKGIDFKGKAKSRFFGWSERGFEAVANGYSNLLAWALGHRRTVVVLSVLIFGGSLALLPLLGTEFMPEEDKATLEGTMFLPVGTRVEETKRVMTEIDRMMNEEISEKERVAVFTRAGTTPYGIASVFGQEGANIGMFGVKLVPRVRRSRNVKEIAAALRTRIEALRGPLLIEKFRIETGDHMEGIMLGGEQPLTVNIIGDDMDTTDEIAAQIKKIAENTPGAVDITVSREKGRPELWLDVDREKASSLGMSLYGIGDTMRASFYGRVAGKYRVPGNEYDIFVRLREGDRAEVSDMLAAPVRTASGGLARADNISDVVHEYGPIEIERKNQGRIVNVLGSVYGRSIGEVVADIEEKIKQLEIPQGIEVAMAGQTEQQRESFFWLSVSLAVGILLVYMVMASQFESLRDPFVVLFSVPFALTGVIWALFFGGHTISVVVFVGMLLLIGVVVNNAIVLVDYTNILRARGVELSRAIREAGKTRLRPVLMTTLTTVFALIPMAFGRGQGAEVWNPLGLTILVGLTVSTLVTLVLVPTIYSLFEGGLSWKFEQPGGK